MSEAVHVGIECDVEERAGRRLVRVHEGYVDAVLDAGGVPVLLPPVLDASTRGAFLSRVEALLLSGGKDIPAAEYGERERRTPRTTDVDPRRYEASRALFLEASERSLPVLGICLGAQLVNVARGGSLVQDIPDEVPGALAHRTDDAGRDAEHEVEIAPGSLLARAVGTARTRVSSAHHQSIARPGRGLRVVARAPDGVVEAVEGEEGDRFLLAVQWHPERMGREAEGRRVVAALVEAARARRGG